jgi:hypothetical protein
MLFHVNILFETVFLKNESMFLENEVLNLGGGRKRTDLCPCNTKKCNRKIW